MSEEEVRVAGGNDAAHSGYSPVMGREYCPSGKRRLPFVKRIRNSFHRAPAEERAMSRVSHVFISRAAAPTVSFALDGRVPMSCRAFWQLLFCLKRRLHLA